MADKPDHPPAYEFRPHDATAVYVCGGRSGCGAIVAAGLEDRHADWHDTTASVVLQPAVYDPAAGVREVQGTVIVSGTVPPKTGVAAL